MNKQASRKRNSRKQKGGCGLKPLSPASLDMGSLTGGRNRRKTNKKRAKKGGNVGTLAAAGLLGTLLALGSRKRKAKGKRTRHKRSSKKR